MNSIIGMVKNSDMASVSYDVKNCAIRIDAKGQQLSTLETQIKNFYSYHNVITHLILHNVLLSEKKDVDLLKEMFDNFKYAKEFNLKNLTIGEVTLGYLYFGNRPDAEKKVTEIISIFQ